MGEGEVQMGQLNKQNEQEGDYLSNIKEMNRVSLLSTILGYLSMEEGESASYDTLPNRSTMAMIVSNLQQQGDSQE